MKRPGEQTFHDAVRRWARRIGVRPNDVRIVPMRRKWASCSPAGRLSFSRALLQETPGFRRAVIVHELLHLRVPNHGKLFKSLMSAYAPGWEHASRGRVSGAQLR